MLAAVKGSRRVRSTPPNGSASGIANQTMYTYKFYVMRNSALTFVQKKIKNMYCKVNISFTFQTVYLV